MKQLLVDVYARRAFQSSGRGRRCRNWINEQKSEQTFMPGRLSTTKVVLRDTALP